ncbi:hypothetical protein N2152v2_008108 [Parachlorella kessleri]
MSTAQHAQHQGYQPQRTFRTATATPYSYTSGADDELEPQMPAHSAAEHSAAEQVPHLATAAEAAAFVRERLPQGLAVNELGAVMKRMVELHFQQLARRGPRSETTGPMSEIVTLVLGDSSPLRGNGPAVTYVLWAAAKLRYRSDPASQEVFCKAWALRMLAAAAGRGLGSCAPHSLPPLLWALGTLRLTPPNEFWEQVTNRLFGEGLVSYFRTDELIMAVLGMASLQAKSAAGASQVADFLVEELLKKSNHLRPREAGGICDFLPRLQQTPSREQLADKVFSQAQHLARDMDLIELSTVLWAAAKLEYPMPHEPVRALLDSAQAQLGSNRGHAVPGLLWSLAKLGYRVDDDAGVVTEDFVRACIDSQMATIDRRVPPQKITKFLNACGVLGVSPSGPELQACLDSIQEQNYHHMDAYGLRSLLRAFHSFQFWPGVDALKAHLGIERPPRGGGRGSEGGSPQGEGQGGAPGRYDGRERRRYSKERRQRAAEQQAERAAEQAPEGAVA